MAMQLPDADMVALHAIVERNGLSTVMHDVGEMLLRRANAAAPASVVIGGRLESAAMKVFEAKGLVEKIA